ncbi:MAG: FtsX-like permease family protein [Candidatus Levybacteria bacterium]|nr:FtsX-like permease family protein [Candidatus Levybacteria bacterium]
MGSLNTAWFHIRRSPYQAFAAIFIMFQTFFVISFFTFILVGATKIIEYFESVPKVTVFFKDEAKPENIQALGEQMKATGKVANMRFVSKEEALKIYKDQNKDDPLLLDLVTADILPASLEIQTTKIDHLSEISNMLKSSPIIREGGIVFQESAVAKLKSWTSSLRQIGAILIGVLALDSIFIMIIIIGIKISQKKEEIEITRLLGATNWYVRWPFVQEGIFYGVIGAFFGWLVSTAGLLIATPTLSETLLKGIPLLPPSPVFLLELLFAELIFAVILGTVASFLAVLRYLK